ncbi:hypothetical protein FB451DRAFT_1488806 [Mycena latifolia]|nr:hypothetical protein FB451DRAFT_1488806 [Mycena latifolia]
MLRLGRKYDISNMQTDAISRLRQGFPTTLEAFYESLNPPYSFGGIQGTPGFLVALLKLVDENGATMTIPILGLLCLAEYSLEALFSGFDQEGAPIVTLSDAMKLKLALAVEKIQVFQVTNLQWLTNTSEKNRTIPSRLCEDRHKCSKARDVMARLGLRDKNRLDVSHLIHPWSEVGGGAWKHALCEPCEKAAMATYSASCIKAWEQLPIFFGLPDWKDLKDTY